MSRPVKKLFDLEIDEVSVVDRAANQHSLIAFSKSAGGASTLEDSMSDLAITDDEGVEVDVNDLEHGDVVYDDAGNEYVFIEDGVEEDEDGVEKADFTRLLNRGKYAWQDAKGRARAARVMGRRGARNAGDAAEGEARGVVNRVRSFYTAPNDYQRGAFQNAKGEWQVPDRVVRRGRVAATGAGGAAVVGAGGYGAYEATKKSLGDSVLEELSKAVTDRDRERIIAKAMGEVEIAKAEAREAWEYAQAEADIRIEQEFVAKAATYNLPVAAEVLGPILKSMAEVLEPEQLEIVDELFNAVGDALYNEIGFVGESSNNSVLDAVDAYADDLVGKSDLTREQAMTAMFEANPSAYDAYINEKGI